MKTPNKNGFLVLFLLLLASLPAWSQESAEPRRMLYRELGFNASGILQHIPILPDTDVSLNSYDIVYRTRRWNKRAATRFAMSGRFAVGGNGQNLPNSIIIKWGKEWHYILLEKWSYYVGFDILAFSQNNGNGGGLGTGPIGGLRFKINDKLFLSTESSLYLTLGGSNDLNIGITARPPNGLALNLRFF